MLSRTIFIKPVGNCCNMNCLYCFEKNSLFVETQGLLSADDAISYLESYKNYQNIFIVFHGGEPMIAGEEYFKKVLDFISTEFNGNVNVQIQTNGSLFKESWVSLLKPYKKILSFSFSLDPIGTKDLRYHDDCNLRTEIINNLERVNSEFDNTGIISVMHKYNHQYFIKFIELLIDKKIKNITINKFRFNNDSEFSITEEEYSKELINITLYWIKNKLYKKIHIQPLNALLSDKNKICLYLNDIDKCKYFSVLEPNLQYNHCYHIKHPVSQVNTKCKDCSISDFCGGGCLAESIDNDFCKGRFILHDFIGRLKNDH